MSTVKSWAAEWWPWLGRQLPPDIFSILFPADEGGYREVIHDDALAGAGEIEQRLIGPVAPALIGPPVLVVEHDEIVGGQRFGSGATKLLRHPNVKTSRSFQNLAQLRRDGTPVVGVVTGDDQGSYFSRRCRLL